MGFSIKLRILLVPPIDLCFSKHDPTEKVILVASSGSVSHSLSQSITVCDISSEEFSSWLTAVDNTVKAIFA